MNKTFGLLFYLKKSKVDAQGKCPIYLRITIDGKRTEISSKRTIEAERWNIEANKAIGRTEDIRELNAYLDSLTTKVYQSIITEIIPQSWENKETVILYCPGGAFISGPNDINWKTILKITKETGLTTFLIDYPKAPEVTIEEINANIDAVYDYLVEQKSIKNIVLIGDSVGGTLLMLLVQRLLKLENAILPKSVYLISPVTDCSLTNPEIHLKDKKDILLSLKGVLSAKLMCAGNIDLKNEIISPLYGSFINFIPTSLFIAEDDIMQPDQEILVDKMIAEKVNLKVYRGQGMPHIWPLLPFMKEAKETLNVIIENIKNNTR